MIYYDDGDKKIPMSNVIAHRERVVYIIRYLAFYKVQDK